MSNELGSPGKSLSLKNFPPKLRKIALFIAKSEKKKTIKECCQELNLKYNSITSMIYQEKQKGNNFHELIGEYSLDNMRSKLHLVDDSVTEQAIQGSERHANLYYKRLGILKDSPLVTVDFKSVTVVATPGNIPASVAKQLPEISASELEIEGPKK